MENTNLQQQETCGMKGIYTITTADVSSLEAARIQTMIEGYRERGNDPKQMKRLIDVLNTRYLVSRQVVHNLLPTVGRSAIAQRLANTTTYTNIVNKVALGSGTTAPANADTTLATEVYRNNAASLTYSSNIAYITGFFTAAETSGTYGEAGLFIDGTATANTGQLLSRALISVTKTATQTLTVDWQITIS